MPAKPKDIIGLRFGMLIAIFPADRDNKNRTQWLFRCDCNRLGTRRTADVVRKNGIKSCGCLKHNDVAGRRFGKLTAIRVESKDIRGRTTWKCECACGQTVNRTLNSLMAGHSISCGCARKENRTSRRLDLSGQRFGLLVATRPVSTPGTAAAWVCACDCGAVSTVTTNRLRSGHTRSCGCLKTQVAGRTRLPNNAAKINSLLTNYKRKARKRNIEFTLTKDEFKGLLSGDCDYCGASPSQILASGNGDAFLYNGIDRVDSSKAYTKNNCVSCCKFCNYAKNSMTVDEFFEHIMKIVKHNQLLIRYNHHA